MTDITWFSSDGTELTSEGDYTIADGSYANSQQIATLTVASTSVATDQTFTCSVESEEWTGTVTTTVQLNVYG